MEISEDNIKWLNQWYPELKVNKFEDHSVLEGIFRFRVGYNKKRKKYIFLEQGETPSDGTRVIEDSYKIRITFRKNGNCFREVEEIGGKIKEIAKIKGITDLRELHFYENDSKVCVIGYLDEDLDISFIEFLDRVILQFFYDQSYFRRYDKWPRKVYSHGILGLLENYYYQSRKMSVDTDMTKQCLKELNKNKNKSGKAAEMIKEMLGQGKIPRNFSSNGFKMVEEEEETIARFEKYMRKKKNNNGWNCISCKGCRFLDCHKEAFYGLKILKKQMKKQKLKL